jgi:hypothetical protein
MDCVLRCSALGWHGCCLLGWAADLFNLICYSSWRLSIRWKPPFCVHLSLSSRRTPWHGVQWYTTVPDLEINTGESISADQPITPAYIKTKNKRANWLKETTMSECECDKTRCASCSMSRTI